MLTLCVIVVYTAITVTFTDNTENISDDNEDDFLHSTAAVAVTVITSVCVLNKLATYCVDCCE